MRVTQGISVLFLAGIIGSFEVPIAWSQDTVTTTKYLYINTSEPISEAAAEIIQQIGLPPTLDQLLSGVQTHTFDIDNVCNDACKSSTEDLWNSFTTRPGIQDVRLPGFNADTPTSNQLFIANDVNAGRRVTHGQGGFALSGQYLMLDSTNPLYSAYGLGSSRNGETVAIPLPRTQSDDSILGVGPPPSNNQGILLDHTGSIVPRSIVFDLGWGSYFDEANEKIERSGRTIIRIPLVEAVSQTDLDAIAAATEVSTIEVRSKAEPKDQFIAPDSFESADSTQCSVPTKNWPFNVSNVERVIARNNETLRQYGFQVHRSKVLVVDTGIEHAFLSRPEFTEMSYPNLSEWLFRTRVFFDVFNGDGSAQCRDWDGNGYTGDVFGRPKFSCDEYKGPLSAIVALNPLTETVAAQNNYKSGHGVFVAGLALGGPPLLKTAKSNIGVVHYRVSEAIHNNSGTVTVQVNPDFVLEAIKYAIKTNIDIVNLSLKTSDAEIYDMNREGIALSNRTLFVTSAGNDTRDLSDILNRNFPASLRLDGSGSELRRRMIVVSAVQPSATGEGYAAWLKSNKGDLVDIAAPGFKITSFGPTGSKVCASGTSAAAPLVSFTAGLLRSFGMGHAISIKKRILATADTDPNLASLSRDGRVLNIGAAIDVYVDQLYLKGNPNVPRRGRLIESNSGVGSTLDYFPVCPRPSPLGNFDDIDRTNGLVDLAFVQNLERQPNGDFKIMFDINKQGVTLEKVCQPLGGSFRFKDFETGEEEPIDWQDVYRIIPSPFRAAILRETFPDTGLVSPIPDPIQLVPLPEDEIETLSLNFPACEKDGQQVKITECRVEGVKGIRFQNLCVPADIRRIELSNVTLSNVGQLARLDMLKDLLFENVTICRSSGIGDLKMLEALRLRNTRIASIGAIAKLTNLNLLDLSGSIIQNLDPVAELPELRRIWLKDTRLDDLSPLKNNTRLHYIELPNGQEIGGWASTPNNRIQVHSYLSQF